MLHAELLKTRHAIGSSVFGSSADKMLEKLSSIYLEVAVTKDKMIAAWVTMLKKVSTPFIYGTVRNWTNMSAVVVGNGILTSQVDILSLLPPILVANRSSYYT